MSIFVESIKRLFNCNQIGRDKVMELYKNGKLTIEEVNYILEK